MKNEKMAYALTHIDDDLILEAAQAGESRGGRVLKWQRAAVRWGSLAACLLLAVGIVLGSMSGGVTMDGQRLGEQPTPIAAAAPRSTPQAIGYSVDKTTLDFTLDFAKSTSLTPAVDSLAVVNPDGSLTPVSHGYTLRGAVTLRLTLDSAATSATITTDRGYDLVLSQIDGEWYINIEK